jgi:hypothetical protein
MVVSCPHCGARNRSCDVSCVLVDEFKWYAATGGWNKGYYKAISFQKQCRPVGGLDAGRLVWEDYTPTNEQKRENYEYKWFGHTAKATHFSITREESPFFEWVEPNSARKHRAQIPQDLWDRIKRYIAALKKKTFNPLEMPAPLWTIIYKFKPGRGARALEYSSPMAAYNELVKKADEWKRIRDVASADGNATNYRALNEAKAAYTTELLKNPWGSPGPWTFTTQGRVQKLLGSEPLVPFLRNYSQHPAQTLGLLSADGMARCGLAKPDGRAIEDKDWKYHPVVNGDYTAACQGARYAVQSADPTSHNYRPNGLTTDPNRNQFINEALEKFKEEYICLRPPGGDGHRVGWIGASRNLNGDSRLSRRAIMYEPGIRRNDVVKFNYITDVYCFAELVRTMACGPHNAPTTNPENWWGLRPAMKIRTDSLDYVRNAYWCGWSWMLAPRPPPELTAEQEAARAEREARRLAEQRAKQKEREYKRKRQEELERELRLLRNPQYVKECVIAECDDPNDPIHGDVNFAAPPEGEHSCCVCLGGEEEGQLFQLTCGHIFHKGCISQAVEAVMDGWREPKCPLCRAPTFGKALKPYTQLTKTIETQTDYDSDADSDVYGPVEPVPVREVEEGIEEWRAARLARFG